MSKCLTLLFGAVLIFAGYALSSSAEPLGCCYFPTQEPFCQDSVNQITCDSLGGTSALGGNYWVGQACADQNECEIGCCCGASLDKNVTVQGVCLDNSGSFTQGSYNETTCKQLCQVNCVPDPIQECGIDSCGIDHGSCSSGYTCSAGECVAAPQCDNTCDGVCVDSGCTSDPDCVSVDGDLCCTPGETSITDSDCNDCTEFRGTGTQSYICSDACLDDSTTHDPGSYNPMNTTPNLGCQQALPYCCEEPAPDYVECCDYSWQCDDPLPYAYASCLFNTPCNSTCSRVDCLNNFQIKDSSSESFCWCGSSAYNTSDSYEGDLWCCDGSASESECGKSSYTLKGQVTSSADSEPIDLAYVLLNGVLKNQTNGTGWYSISNVPTGTRFDPMFVSKPGYLTTKDVVESYVGTAGIVYQDFMLSPIQGGWCDAAAVQDVDGFAVHHIKGKEAVNLTWDFLALNGTIGYEIVRDPSFPSSVFIPLIDSSMLPVTTYIDDNVSWSSVYNYTLYVYYDSGFISNGSSANLTLGDPYCQGIDQNEEFCLDSSKGKSGILTGIHTCDAKNRVVEVTDRNFDCSAQNSGLVYYVCAGPDVNNQAYCKKTDPSNYCHATIQNPFGLFFDEQLCLGSDNYCYYDYSSTSVDSCFNCGVIVNCQSYQSKDACEQDSCIVSGNALGDGINNGCAWIGSEYSELGKGYCIDKDYIGTSYCDLCTSDNSELFANAYCDQQTCSSLGSCYLSSTSCTECLSTTSCEDFTTQQACTAASSPGGDVYFTLVPNSVNPESIRASDDACGLDRCRWGTPPSESTARCFKDGNDDSKPDCGSGNTLCKQDTEPSETLPLEPIPRLNASGRDIHLQVVNGHQYANQLRVFKYCLNESDDCIPLTSVPIQSTGYDAIFNPVSSGLTKAGLYYLRYFTVDVNNNTETVHSIPLYIDPLKPDMDVVSYSTGDAANHETYLEVSSPSEAINCSYTSSDLIGEEVLADSFGSGFSCGFRAIFDDLDEGEYSVTITCTDIAGNEVVKNHMIVIDFISNAYPKYPDGKNITDTHFKFTLETLDNSSCNLVSFIGYDSLMTPLAVSSSLPIPLVQRKIVVGTEIRYEHVSDFVNLASDSTSYIVKAVCDKRIGGTDTGTFHFTVDKLAPVTTTNVNFSKHYTSTSGPVEVKLTCNDPPINGSPGEAGCAVTYYCEGSSNCDPTIKGDTLYFDTEGNNRLAYYSIDTAGNQEIVQRQTLFIDNHPPTLSLDPLQDIQEVTIPSHSPYPPGKMQVTSTRLQNIHGTAQDISSSLQKVEITKQANATTSNTTLAVLDAPVTGSYPYHLNILLFNGYNKILVKAFDEAGNYADNSTEVYLDIFPPTLTRMKVFDTDSSHDSDTDNRTRKLEWGYNASFTATIRDDMAGVQNAFINIYYKNGTPAMLNTPMMSKDDEYAASVQGLITEDYDVQFVARDILGNTFVYERNFTVQDTKAPTLTWDKPTTPTFNIYQGALTFEGYASEPDVNIEFVVSNQITGDTHYTILGTGVSRQVGYLSLYDPIGTPGLPSSSSTVLYLNGTATSLIGNGYYLDFEIFKNGILTSYRTTPRHKAMEVNASCGFQGEKCTKILLDKPFGAIAESDPTKVPSDGKLHGFVSVYDRQSSTPTSYFNINIPLDSGSNIITVKGKDINNQYSPSYTFTVLYDTSGPSIIPAIYRLDGKRVDNISWQANAKYRQNITFSAELQHATGIHNASVTLDCLDNSCHYGPFRLRNTSMTSYAFTLDPTILEIGQGNYSARYEAISNTSSRSYNTLKFFVEDSLPPTIQLLYPRTQVTNVTEPNVLINTSESANCSLSYSGGTYIGKFQTLDMIYHNFTLHSGYLQEGQNRTFDATCTDMSHNTGSIRFGILLDKKAPKIHTLQSSRLSPIYNTLPDGSITSLHVETDIETTCRYIGFRSNQAVMPTFQQMRNFSNKDFSTQQDQDITPDIVNLSLSSPAKGNFTFYASCQAKNYLTTAINMTKIEVDIGSLFWLYKKPDSTISIDNPVLQIKTNQLSACDIDTGNGWDTFGQSSTDAKSMPVTLPDEDYYEFPVRCYLGNTYNTTPSNRRFSTAINFTYNISRAYPQIHHLHPLQDSKVGRRAVVFNGTIDNVPEFGLNVLTLNTGSGPVNFTLHGANYSTIHTYTADGNFTATIEAKNTGGFSSTITIDFTVDTRPPHTPGVEI